MQRRSFIVGSFLAATAGGAQLAAPANPDSAQPGGPRSCAAANPGPAKTGGPRSCAAAPAPRSILELNPPEQILPLLQNMRMRAIKPVPHKPPVYQQEQLTLLHFADIHNDVKNLRRVMEFANHYKPYLTDALLTGDIAGGSWNDWKDEMMAVPGFTGVLKTLGNHDIYKWNKTNRDATPRECYLAARTRTGSATGTRTILPAACA